MSPGLPSPALALAPPQSRSGVLEALGLACLYAFLFLIYSRFLEVVAGNSFRLPLILGSLACAAALFSGALHRLARSTIARLLFLFTCWFVLCIPFAFWKGGSFGMLTNRWSRSFLIFFAIASLVRTLPQMRRISLVLVFSIGTAMALTNIYGVVGPDGRLAMARGELANANQLAMVALMGLPLSLGVLADQTRSKLVRFLSVMVIGLLLVAILRTGSRTAVLALVLLAGLVWLIAPVKGKVIGLVVLLAGGAVAVALLPQELLARYGTLFTSSAEAASEAERGIMASSEESTASRLKVIREGIEFTLERPIFGYGPGNFVERRNQKYWELYGHHGYLESHNSYVQVASEMGIPGVALFIAFFAATYRTAARIYKNHLHATSGNLVQIKHQALALRLIVAVMALFCFFNHIAYDFYLPTVAGLIVALEAVVRERQAAPPQSTPRPAAPPLWSPAPEPALATPRPRLNGTPRYLSRPDIRRTQPKA
jgi:O-antigen ligase